MRRFDARVQREFRRTMNERHQGFVAGMIVLVAIPLALLGYWEVGICIYAAVGFWLSVMFKRIYWRAQDAEKA